VHPARDRSPRRCAVRRPARRADPQDGDEGDPRGAVGRPGEPDDQAQPARVDGPRLRPSYAGTPGTALPTLQALLDADRHEVVAVITRPPAPAGGGRHVEPSPVAELAARAGVRVLTPRRAGEPEFLAELAGLQVDCCPVVAYGALLPLA